MENNHLIKKKFSEKNDLHFFKSLSFLQAWLKGTQLIFLSASYSICCLWKTPLYTLMEMREKWQIIF